MVSKSINHTVITDSIANDTEKVFAPEVTNGTVDASAKFPTVPGVLGKKPKLPSKPKQRVPNKGDRLYYLIKTFDLARSTKQFCVSKIDWNLKNRMNKKDPTFMADISI